jgi:hypothetical protein
MTYTTDVGLSCGLSQKRNRGFPASRQESVVKNAKSIHPLIDCFFAGVKINYLQR